MLFYTLFKEQWPLTLSVSTALRILSQDLSWTICSHLWMEPLNQLWKPVKANILASLLEKNICFYFINSKLKKRLNFHKFSLTFQTNNHPIIRHAAIWIFIRVELKTNLRGRNSRNPLRIFMDMKSSNMVSPIVWVSLELSCSRVPHTRSIATFTSSATWRIRGFVQIPVLKCKNQQQYDNFIHINVYIFRQIPVSPIACMLCWRNLLSLHCESK